MRESRCAIVGALVVALVLPVVPAASQPTPEIPQRPPMIHGAPVQILERRPELRALFEGTPAGDYLRSLEASEAASAARAAEWAAYVSPEAVAQRKAERREKRKLAKQPEMEARAARKAERDRLWRLRQAPDS